VFGDDAIVANQIDGSFSRPIGQDVGMLDAEVECCSRVFTPPFGAMR